MISCHMLHIAKEKMFSKAAPPTEFFESFFFLFFFFLIRLINQMKLAGQFSIPSQLAASPKVKEKKKHSAGIKAKEVSWQKLN